MQASTMPRIVLSMLIVAAVALALTVGVILAQRELPGRERVTVCLLPGQSDAQVEVVIPEVAATRLVARGIAVLGPCPVPYS